ncbi:MAG: hypothetical protein JXR70_13095 [Spirochaetales bacterium]|nr:hypothetical protein [Spirochaetales bacterium]
MEGYYWLYNAFLGVTCRPGAWQVGLYVAPLRSESLRRGKFAPPGFRKWFLKKPFSASSIPNTLLSAADNINSFFQLFIG